jgi:nitrous oxidase accessory protein
MRGPALAAALLVLHAGPARSDEMVPVAPGNLEGRPARREASPLQKLVDAAPDGATIEVPAGSWEGDLYLDRPVRLVGKGWPVLRGSRSGSVVRVRAPNVTVEGFVIDGREGGDLGRDSAGVHVAAPGARIRSCRIRQSLFGVYVREGNGVVVESCDIRGIPGKAPGEKGSGIHVWNTVGFTLRGNVIRDVRDGFYIQSSSRGLVASNHASDLRYGIHYMFSDDNAFEDNVFENGAAGSALMYSKRIAFRRNQFLRNRGFASVGLLFKTCDEVVAEGNLLADNARGVFFEDSYRNVFRGNVVASSDTAIVLYAGSGGNRITGNSFVGNLTPLTLVGRRTDTVFDGNYWSENREPDLDGDGRTDRPYRLGNVFDHFRGNLLAADLFAQSFAAGAIGVAEETFPVLRQQMAMDSSPLARPPHLPDVPRARPESRAAEVPAAAASTVTFLLGTALLVLGRRLPAA